MMPDGAVLAVIPARGGSKGVPRKNLRALGGKPLLAWSIEAAYACPAIDRLILSSDDEEIMECARAWGCEVPFRRPEHLSGDEVSATEAALHALETLPESYAYVVLLQPTSPLRTGADIQACLERCAQPGVEACVSMSRAEKSPWWMYTLDPDGGLSPLLGEDRSERQRQQLPPVYHPNGAVYVARPPWLRRTRKFLGAGTKGWIMPTERSIDIDTEEDFQRAVWHLERNSPPGT